MSERYDAGILNDFGGGNVDWWQDYIRAEIERANDFHALLHEHSDAIIAEMKNEIAGLRRFRSFALGNTSVEICPACSEPRFKGYVCTYCWDDE